MLYPLELRARVVDFIVLASVASSNFTAPSLHNAHFLSVV
jgi:hypothetical protein